MSLHHNPRIVTDGLVFAYDMDNAAKSFKGKPTTNLITSTIDNWSGSSLRNATLLNETYKRSAVYRLEVAAGADPATNVDAYYMYNVPNLSEGDVFTFSADVRVIQKSTATSQTSAADNGFWIWYAGSSEHVNFKDLELGKWTNIQVTATVGSTYDYIWARIDHDNSIIDIANIQLEQQPFATPFVNGTRSNTQALLDMSKSKNTITATSLTYSSDGTFEFDGTSDYITIPEPNVGLSPNSWTIEGWINPENQRSFFITPNSNGIDNFLEYDNTNKRIAVKVCESADTNERYFYSDSQSVPLNTWSHFSASISNLNVKLYINGANHVDQTETISMSDWSGIWHIGRRANGTFYLDGSLSNIKIYNRALTAAEIQQNFNATRGRFGI